MFKAIGNIIYYTFFAAVVGVGLLLMLSLFPFENWYQVKVVLSGSMEPSIQVGSIVVIKPEASYGVGDVITFGADNRQNIPVTHRVIDMTGARFVTKGDANDNIDPGLVNPRDVIGAVQFSVPYVGYLLAFMKTPAGFWTLIIGPAALIVFMEVASIIRRLGGRRKPKADRYTLTI